MAIAKRKKRFFDVDMPILGKETQLQGFDIKDLHNRIIRYDLTRMLRGKSTIMVLKTKVEGDKATASPIEISILPFFFRRIVRKGTSYIEDSFSVECKDATIRIKPLMVSRRKISRIVKKSLREKAKEEIIAELKGLTKEKIFNEILKNQFQKTLSLKLKKIYPLSAFEIRMIKVEKEGKEEKPEKKVEKKK